MHSSFKWLIINRWALTGSSCRHQKEQRMMACPVPPWLLQVGNQLTSFNTGHFTKEKRPVWWGGLDEEERSAVCVAFPMYYPLNWGLALLLQVVAPVSKLLWLVHTGWKTITAIRPTPPSTQCPLLPRSLTLQAWAPWTFLLSGNLRVEDWHG